MNPRVFLAIVCTVAFLAGSVSAAGISLADITGNPVDEFIEPVLHREKCIHCGLCDLVCPDFCLVWGPGDLNGKFERELKGVDYRYCKGCLRCVESCPSGALVKTAEEPDMAAELRVPLFPTLIG